MPRDRASGKIIWNIDTFAVIGLALLSVVVFIAIPWQIPAPKISFGQSPGQISPAFFPRLACLGLLITSVMALLEGRGKRRANPFEGFLRETAIQLFFVTLILWLFAFTFEPLGFLVSGIVTALTLSLYLGNRNLLAIGVVCFGIPVAIYLIFTRVLLISLPEGILY